MQVGLIRALTKTDTLGLVRRMEIGRETTLVTGATGFVGREIVTRLARRGTTVIALTRREIPTATLGGAVPVVVDLSSPPAVAAQLEVFSPRLIIHAAGRVPPSGGVDERLLYDANLGLTLSMIEAMRLASSPARLVVIGSAAQYGLASPADRETRETDALRPISAYGVSKAAAILAAMAAGVRNSLDVVGVVPFNLIGAAQPDHLVPATFLKFALRYPGRRLKVGNVKAQRDFVDVRDAAAAIEAVAMRGRQQTLYNIGSGKPVSIEAVLEIIARQLGQPFSWEADASRFGPELVPVSYADISRVHADTGWRPRIGLEQAIADMVDTMRAQLPESERAAP